MENSDAVEVQYFPERWRRFLWAAGVLMVLLIVAAVSTYTWFALYGPCQVSTVQGASSALMEQLTLFDSIYESIPSLTPIAIFGPITQMEQILMATKEVAVPICMQVARNELISAMEGLIRALLAVMESKPEATRTHLMEESKTHLDNFTAELKFVKRCAPFCP